MTVNHDVVGSSPTGGVYSKRSIIDLFYFLEKAPKPHGLEAFLLVEVTGLEPVTLCL